MKNPKLEILVHFTLYVVLYSHKVSCSRLENLHEELHQTYVSEIDLIPLFSGTYSSYSVSNKPADAITAEETCRGSNKHLTLLAIENENEFYEILPYLQATVGVESVWTSGLETAFKSSSDLFWSGTAIPMEYTNFPTTIHNFLAGLSRTRRAIHGYYPGGGSCNCDNDCSERPSCLNINCTITGETCDLVQPTCSEPLNQDCHLVNPPPVCTVTCPPCVLKRGDCHLIQPNCTVKPGTPTCTTTRRGHCTVTPVKYEMIPGKCQLIQEPCKIPKPKTPCERPVNCSFQYKPNSGSNCGSSRNAPSHGDMKQEDNSLHKCSICPPEMPECPNPCPSLDDHCHRVFQCVPDLICQPPPVVCPPPIYHCLPAELVQVSNETLDCDEPETQCEPPIVECTEVQKKCEEDVITCPQPHTTCTPAVSHCDRPEYSCTNPIVECQEPTVNCPALPECKVPVGCYGSQGYPQKPVGGCNCRGKRDIKDKGALVSARCVSLKKNLDFKWKLEECNNKNYFICEEPLVTNGFESYV